MFYQLAPNTYGGGAGGDGGNGRTPGVGGEQGVIGIAGAGTNGSINDNSIGWGQNGVDNGALKGLAGSGIVDGVNSLGLTADVVLFGATAARYVNGNGDH